MTIRGLGVAADKPRCRGQRWRSQLSFLLTRCAPLQNLSGCSCLTSVPAENATVVPGKCPSPGCEEAFLTFLCVMCVCSMIGAMAQTPSVIILIRWGFSHHPHQLGLLLAWDQGWRDCRAQPGAAGSWGSSHTAPGLCLLHQTYCPQIHDFGLNLHSSHFLPKPLFHLVAPGLAVAWPQFRASSVELLERKEELLELSFGKVRGVRWNWACKWTRFLQGRCREWWQGLFFWD